MTPHSNPGNPSQYCANNVHPAATSKNWSVGRRNFKPTLTVIRVTWKPTPPRDDTPHNPGKIPPNTALKCKPSCHIRVLIRGRRNFKPTLTDYMKPTPSPRWHPSKPWQNPSQYCAKNVNPAAISENWSVGRNFETHSERDTGYMKPTRDQISLVCRSYGRPGIKHEDGGDSKGRKGKLTRVLALAKHTLKNHETKHVVVHDQHLEPRRGEALGMREAFHPVVAVVRVVLVVCHAHRVERAGLHDDHHPDCARDSVNKTTRSRSKQPSQASSPLSSSLFPRQSQPAAVASKSAGRQGRRLKLRAH